MFFFDKINKKSSTVWRDINGQITCPGDDCPQECDNTCPIWCQTMAITMMETGHEDKAIDELKKALIIAPDFKDAWVNLAAIYGGMNNHLEANKAYKAAYAIDQNYTNAIYGLIISCKNLGRFDEALKYCDEYAQKVGNAEAENVRDMVLEAKRLGKISRQESALDMALKIIDHARKEALLPYNDHFPHIPEIMFEAKRTCQKIYQDMTKDEKGRHPILWLVWGAFAGMGAVWHWQIDWNSMYSKGVAETLLEPRGSFAMDEYVLDSIGIPFESEEGAKLEHDISNLAKWTYIEFVKDSSKEVAMQVAMQLMQSMYIFGMVYEMERLGMR